MCYTGTSDPLGWRPLLHSCLDCCTLQTREGSWIPSFPNPCLFGSQARDLKNSKIIRDDPFLHAHQFVQRFKFGWGSLHNATLKKPLYFFPLLSSSAGFHGNAGQSNYVPAVQNEAAICATLG